MKRIWVPLWLYKSTPFATAITGIVIMFLLGGRHGLEFFLHAFAGMAFVIYSMTVMMMRNAYNGDDIA